MFGVPALEAAAPGYPSLLHMASLWTLARDTALHQRLHAAVKALPADVFPELSKAEADKRLAGFDERIAGLEAERRAAERAARIAEVEAEFEGVAVVNTRR